MVQKPIYPSLQIRMLGSLQIKKTDCALNISRRKVQALLCYLALNPDFQQRATLATLLWPESDQQYAFGSLRRHLSELNRLLGPGWIETEQDAVRLAQRADLWVDVREFQRLLATCRDHGHSVDAVCARCIEPLTAATDLYRDDFLGGFSLPDAPNFDEWQLFQREELRFALVTALDRLCEAHEAQQNLTDAIAIARRRLNLDSLHEPAHRKLMVLYARSGQQSAAVRQYERCVQLLKTEVDVPPTSETTALYEQIRQGNLATADIRSENESQPPQSARHNLTAPTTPLVGRTTEVTELVRLVTAPTQRLITILGPGGIGKTRLALAVAHQLVNELGHDTFMVYLARLSDPAIILPTIADALNFQFQTDGRPTKVQLFAYLAQKQLYLVLDNFEHLLGGVHLIQELLEQCPQVHLIVTSRERLKLTGETIYTLKSLDFPTWETPGELQRYDAVRLFFEAVRRVRPNVDFQAEEMQYIARICRMVGGMPLGIILAATWVEHFAPATIAAQLTISFDLLETELHDLPARQRSMRTILDYSWQRLTTGEQDVFMRLAIFQGGFTRGSAQSVAGATLPILVHLVDKSFLQSLGDERYEIHELLRQYARQRLEIAEAMLETQRMHAKYYLDLLHDAEARLTGAQQLTAIHQIEADFQNIRVAWQWAVTHEEYALIDRALDGLFHWLWLRRSRQHEGLALLQVALDRWSLAKGVEARSVWGRIAVRMVEQQGPWLVEPATVRERAERALAIAEQKSDQAEIACCHWVIGLTIVSANRLLEREMTEPAIPHYEFAIAFYRAHTQHFWLAQSLEFLGHNYRSMEQYAYAMETLNESLTLRQKLEDRLGMARSYREIAWVRFYQGLECETIEAAETALTMQREFGDRQGIADSRFFLALSLLCCGEWQRAKGLVKPVVEFAGEVKNDLYQKWAADVLRIATAMEEHMIERQLDACAFPNHFTLFTPRLMAVIFAKRGYEADFNLIALRRPVRKLLLTASNEQELAICLPFAAILWTHMGNHYRALQILALAASYLAFVDSWVSYLPEVIQLEQALRDRLSPAEFAQAWAEGQVLNLQATVAELIIED